MCCDLRQQIVVTGRYAPAQSESKVSPGAVAAVAALLPGCSDAVVSDAKHGRLFWLLEDLSLLAAMRAI